MCRTSTRTVSVSTQCLARIAPHRCVDAHFCRGCGWHASCHFHVRDSNRSSFRDTQRTDSRVLLPRVSFANVRPRSHRGDSLYPLGVGKLTLPPASPTPCRTMGGFSVEPFIVFRSRVRHVGFPTCPCVTILRRGGGAGMVPTKVNTSGSSLARWSSKRRMRILAAAVCLLALASAPSAAEPALVTLAVSEGKDIRFAHLTSKDGLPPGTDPRHSSGRSGFFVVQHLGRAEPVRRLPVQVLSS